MNRCHVCEESEEGTDLELCAACRKFFCPYDCGGWCHTPGDEDCGDYYCHFCQQEADDEEGEP